jgi:hypothetical protein
MIFALSLRNFVDNSIRIAVSYDLCRRKLLSKEVTARGMAAQGTGCALQLRGCVGATVASTWAWLQMLVAIVVRLQMLKLLHARLC